MYGLPLKSPLQTEGLFLSGMRKNVSRFLDEGFYPSSVNFCLAGHRLS